MTLKRKAAGAWTDITTTLSRRESGSWVGIDLVKRRLSGAWTTLWQRIGIGDENIADSRGSGAAVAGYRLNTSGVIESRLGAAYATIGQWLALGSAGDYECFVTVNSGTLTLGTSGSWLALSSSCEWYVSQATVGVKTANITVQIRRASSGTVLDSATIDLEAERT